MRYDSALPDGSDVVQAPGGAGSVYGNHRGHVLARAMATAKTPGGESPLIFDYIVDLVAANEHILAEPPPTPSDAKAEQRRPREISPLRVSGMGISLMRSGGTGGAGPHPLRPAASCKSMSEAVETPRRAPRPASAYTHF